MYLPVRPKAILNDDYYFQANIGKYKAGLDVNSNVDFLPILERTISDSADEIAHYASMGYKVLYLQIDSHYYTYQTY